MASNNHPTTTQPVSQAIFPPPLPLTQIPTNPLPQIPTNPLPGSHAYLLNTLDIFETQIHHLSTTLQTHIKLSRRPLRLAASSERLTTSNTALTSEVTALRTRCAQLTQQNKDLQLVNVRTTAENERLRVNAGGVMHEENRVLGRRVQMAEEEGKELREKVAGLEVEMGNYVEEIRLLTEDNDVYAEEAEEARLERE